MPADQTAPRRDLAAFDYATRAPFALVAKQLIDILGAMVIAYISGVWETGAVQQYANLLSAGRIPVVGSCSRGRWPRHVSS